MVRLLVFVLLLSSTSAWAVSPEVAAHWYDGTAELNGYRLRQPRYGQPRRGTAVYIYVTEPFSESARVKADPGRHPPSDVFQVLKLNAIKDYQTGIYDYNVMTSVFARMEPEHGHRAGAPAKITFSMQEWCGMVFEELLFDPDGIRQKRFSYFDGEGDQTATLPRSDRLVSVDELPILVRSLPAPWLEPGQTEKVRFLPALDRTRMKHTPLEVVAGTLSRGDDVRSFSSPAGSFDIEIWTAEVGDDTYRYYVERAAPHRLIGWDGPGGEQGRLTGSSRQRYWNQNTNGEVGELRALGLTPQKHP